MHYGNAGMDIRGRRDGHRSWWEECSVLYSLAAGSFDGHRSWWEARNGRHGTESSVPEQGVRYIRRALDGWDSPGDNGCTCRYIGAPTGI